MLAIDMGPSKDVFAMATSADPGAGRCHAPITAVVAQEDLGSKPPLAWQDTNIAEGPDDYKKPTSVCGTGLRRGAMITVLAEQDLSARPQK